jgi:hypothetical protein
MYMALWATNFITIVKDTDDLTPSQEGLFQFLMYDAPLPLSLHFVVIALLFLISFTGILIKNTSKWSRLYANNIFPHCPAATQADPDLRGVPPHRVHRRDLLAHPRHLRAQHGGHL